MIAPFGSGLGEALGLLVLAFLWTHRWREARTSGQWLLM